MRDKTTKTKKMSEVTDEEKARPGFFSIDITTDGKGSIGVTTEAQNIDNSAAYQGVSEALISVMMDMDEPAMQFRMFLAVFTQKVAERLEKEKGTPTT